MPRSRKALDHLRNWATQPSRKPLIIRGARQVGKSTLVRMLGQEFSTFIELNVEKPEIQALFTRFSSVEQLFQAILLKYNITQTGDRLLLLRTMLIINKSLSSLLCIIVYGKLL